MVALFLAVVPHLENRRLFELGGCGPFIFFIYIWFTIWFIIWYWFARLGNLICLFGQIVLPTWGFALCVTTINFQNIVSKGIPVGVVVTRLVVIALDDRTRCNALVYDCPNLFLREIREQLCKGGNAIIGPVATVVEVPPVCLIFENPKIQIMDKHCRREAVNAGNIHVEIVIHINAPLKRQVAGHVFKVNQRRFRGVHDRAG